MATGVERLFGKRVVIRGRAADVYHIRLPFRQHIAQTLIARTLQPMALDDLARSFCSRVTKCDQSRLTVRQPSRHVGAARDVTATDNSNTNLFFHVANPAR